MKMARYTNEEVVDIYTNVDERLAKQAAGILDRFYQVREKAVQDQSDQAVTEVNTLIN